MKYNKNFIVLNLSVLIITYELIYMMCVIQILIVEKKSLLHKYIIFILSINYEASKQLGQVSIIWSLQISFTQLVYTLWLYDFLSCHKIYMYQKF